MHPLVDYFWKGREVLKKNQGEFFDNPKRPKKACFIGAIYYGIHKKGLDGDGNDVIFAIANDYPQIREYVHAPVPCGHDDEGGLISAILVHLNDNHTGHDWPDKKIAEWLDKTLSH